jgi:hypothetical protein
MGKRLHRRQRDQHQVRRRLRRNGSTGDLPRYLHDGGEASSHFQHQLRTCSGTTGTPLYTDIVVDGVYATGSPSGSYSEFDGFSTSSPLGLTLENVHLDVTTQQGSQDAKVGLYDSNITPSGTGVTTTSVSGSGTVPTCTF